ncbi:MAG: D-2-hydroxyacid dehydrogenase [Anaerolineae bacterium]|nr:D-2-hydroxyacid dehydrogenase [Anaerolineae bacterium]
MSKPIEILISFPLADELVARLKEISPALNISVHPARQPENIPEELWGKAEVLFTSTVLPLPEFAPNLRWVQLLWAGVENFIDTPLLQHPDITATTMSGANTSQVAEHTLALILALGHKLSALFVHQNRNEWATDRSERFSPLELRDTTVGIVGYGSLGRQVARLLQNFGVTILASKRNLGQERDSGYMPPGMGDPNNEIPRRLYPAPALRSMFKDCDFVVVTVPLTAETLGMIGEDQLAALKPTACIIDVSRGGVIDHQALTQALQEKKLAGAALDVFPEEPLPADSPLWGMPNVIITPHVAGISAHYNTRAVALFGENLRRYINDQPLLNIIDISRGY